MRQEKVKISVIIPTYNAAKLLRDLLTNIKNVHEIIIIDSSSSDNTLEIAKSFKCVVRTIDKSRFNHGGTRNYGSRIASGDLLVFLTQDAILFSENEIHNLVQPFFDSDKISIAYGMQLPHKNSKVFGRIAREINYKQFSYIRSLKDRDRYGIKTIFSSNSFCAYRKEIFCELGGFADNIILGEDTHFAGISLKSGYDIAYVSNAKVYHSHDYNLLQEFKRNFDIGVFHSREKWLIKDFKAAEGEGLKFVKSEMSLLIKHKKLHLLGYSLIRNGVKFFAYKLGALESNIPLKVKRKLSMHKSYWD